MTTFQGRVPELGRCSSCGAVALLDSFRSRDDLRRYKAGDLCQECQDVASAGVAGPDQLKWGAVVGFGTRGPDDLLAGGTPELGFLPFRFVATSRWYRWEPRFVCRVGTGTGPVNAWNELEPMASCWGGCQVRVREYDPSDQCLVEHLSQFALVVGPYRDWLVSASRSVSRPRPLGFGRFVRRTRLEPSLRLRAGASVEARLGGMSFRSAC